MPTANPAQIVKVPVSSYEFGANLIGNKGMMIGRMLTDGRMSGRVKYDLNEALSFKVGRGELKRFRWNCALVVLTRSCLVVCCCAGPSSAC